jgi:hypothetical protein
MLIRMLETRDPMPIKGVPGDAKWAATCPIGGRITSLPVRSAMYAHRIKKSAGTKRETKTAFRCRIGPNPFCLHGRREDPLK